MKGESAAAGYEGKIPVSSLNVEQAPPGANRGQSGRGREDAPTLTNLTFTKSIDGSTAAFQRAMAEGDAVKSASFEFVKSTPEGGASTTFTFNFSEGHFTSHSFGADQGQGAIEMLGAEFAGR